MRGANGHASLTRPPRPGGAAQQATHEGGQLPELAARLAAPARVADRDRSRATVGAGSVAASRATGPIQAAVVPVRGALAGTPAGRRAAIVDAVADRGAARNGWPFGFIHHVTLQCGGSTLDAQRASLAPQGFVRSVHIELWREALRSKGFGAAVLSGEWETVGA